MASTSTGLLRALEWSWLRAGVAVMYHATAPQTGDPERELVPAHGEQLLDEQLAVLAADFQVVEAAHLLQAVLRRGPGRRFPVAITFDDDLASHTRVALGALRRHDLTATFFLTGATLAGPTSFWWQRLQAVWDAGLSDRIAFFAGSPPDGVREAARRIEALDRPARMAVAAELDGLAHPAEDGLSSSDLRRLVAAGHAVGFHTRGHDPLPQLPDRELEVALIDGRDEIEALTRHRITTIAYPHGKADVRVVRAAARAGYRTAFGGPHRAVTARSDPLVLGRLEPPFTSGADLRRRLLRSLVRSAGRHA